MERIEHTAGLSPVERLALDWDQVGEAWTGAHDAAFFRAFAYDWAQWARAEQLPPGGDWRTWLILAGRGFGKTRAGAEWVRGQAEADGSLRIALVAATLAEARAVMVEGDSGLSTIAPPGARPKFEPSLRRLTWPNGARAQLFAASEPEALRGSQHHVAWCDEVAKWGTGAAGTWDNLARGMRLGDRPRIVATTTPKPVKLVKRLVADPHCAVTRGRMIDNRAHLAPDYLDWMQNDYAGRTIGRQELDGELIEDVDGALWSRALIEQARLAGALPEMRRVVIGVDPPAGAAATSDACGIVVVGLGVDGRGHVLADASVRGLSPDGWARAVVQAAACWSADRIVAEANNGGAMIESVLRAVQTDLPLALVHASHGKSARAEPVVALYENGRVAHAGVFPELEDELAGLTYDGRYEGPGRSPDRADALVWAVTELMLGKATPVPKVRVIG
jgi:phage terminase large subunit-like protein